MSWEPPDLIGPILRGLQVRSYLEDIKARREERARRAETHRMNIEAHQQDQALKKFKTQQMLAESGYLPAAASDTGQNDEMIAAAIGGISPENRRPMLEAPGIGRFRAPSQTDRFKRAQVLAQQKGQLEAAEQEAQDPSVEMPVPTELGGGTQRVPGSKRLDFALKIAAAIQKQQPNRKVDSVTNRETGDVTIWSYDPEKPSDAKIERTLPGIAGKGAASATTGGLTPYQQIQVERGARQESRAETKDVEDAISDAQKLIDEATRVDATEPKDPNVSPEWKAARIATERAAKRYPNAIEAGVDANGYPYVKARERTAPAATAVKPGDKRLVRGKMMTITKVYPDGSFDAK